MVETGREAWRKRVGRWRDSGLTAQQFASEIGVSVHSLRTWSSRLRREGGRKAPVPRGRAWPKFIEVRGAARTVSTSMLELVVSDTVVRVPVGFDEATLRRVLVVARQP